MIYKLTQRLKRALGFVLDATGMLQAGIRITEDAIQYVEARRFLGRWRVTRFIEERDFDPRNLEFALSRLFQKKGGILPYAINVVLESKGVISRIITIPHVPKARIASSLVWEIKKYLPFDPGTVVVDHQVLGAADEEGRHVWKVLFTAAKRREVDAVAGQVERFGIRVKAVRYAPLAFVNQFRANPNDTSIAHVSFQDGMVAVSILEKNRLLFTNASWGKGKKILHRHVLDVLKKFIEQRVSFLEKVVVSPGQDELVEQILDQLNILALEEQVEDLAFPVRPDLVAKGHGPFIFSVLRSSVLDVNLVPPEARVARRRTLFTAAVGTAAGILLLAGIFAYAHLRSANSEFAILANKHGSSLPGREAERVDELRRQLYLAESFEKEMDGMEAEIRLLAKVADRSSVWHRAFVGLARIVEERGLYGRLWLLRLGSGERGQGWMEGVALGNRDVTVFLEEIERFASFNGVELEYARPAQIAGASCVEFRVRFRG